MDYTKDTVKDYLNEVISEKVVLFQRYLAGDEEVFEDLVECLEATEEAYRGEGFIRVLITCGGPNCGVRVYPDKAVGYCNWGSDKYCRELEPAELRAFRLIAGVYD